MKASIVSEGDLWDRRWGTRVVVDETKGETMGTEGAQLRAVRDDDNALLLEFEMISGYFRTRAERDPASPAAREIAESFARFGLGLAAGLTPPICAAVLSLVQ